MRIVNKMHRCRSPEISNVPAKTHLLFMRFSDFLDNDNIVGSSTAGRGQKRAVADPQKFTGPPKKQVVVTPTKRAFAESGVMQRVSSKDPTVLASSLREITCFIQRDPNDSDLYLIRATVSCQTADGNKDAVVTDVVTSIRLWKPGDGSAFQSPADHYALKVKIDFLLGRYGDALNDLDQGMRIDYDKADDMFNNANVKPDEAISMPCMWSQVDLDKLAATFPKETMQNRASSYETRGS